VIRAPWTDARRSWKFLV